MRLKRTRIIYFTGLVLALVLSACAGMKPNNTSASDVAADELKLRESKITELEASMKTMEADLAASRAKAEAEARAAAKAEADAAAARKEAKMAGTSSVATTTTRSSLTGGEMLPPNAKPGECYARVFIPPTTETLTERVLTREASERVTTTPAKYEWGTETVLAKEASTRIEVIPATYKWVEEKMLVKPASTSLVAVPAKYDTVEEKVLVTPARTVWKEGRGPIERVDASTGEIMCLIEEPAVYRTVSRKVVTKKASTREDVVPAEYKTVKRQVVAKAAATRTIDIPEERKTIKVRQLVSPASEKRIAIPEEWGTVTKTVNKTDGRMEWREILCQTNMTHSTVRDLQRALQKAGFQPGPIDGVYGSQTKSAVTAYQTKNKLSTGGLTMRTLKALNVRI